MSYSIRGVKYDDMPRIDEMLADLAKITIQRYGMEFDPNGLNAFKAPMINSSFVVEHEGRIVGLLAGQLTTNPATNELMYQEMVWYIEDGHRGQGLKLLTHAQEYCRNNNVKFFIVGHMGNLNERLGTIYKRLGFDVLEIQYIKEL